MFFPTFALEVHLIQLKQCANEKTTNDGFSMLFSIWGGQELVLTFKKQLGWNMGKSIVPLPIRVDQRHQFIPGILT